MKRAKQHGGGIALLFGIGQLRNFAGYGGGVYLFFGECRVAVGHVSQQLHRSIGGFKIRGAGKEQQALHGGLIKCLQGFAKFGQMHAVTGGWCSFKNIFMPQMQEKICRLYFC